LTLEIASGFDLIDATWLVAGIGMCIDCPLVSMMILIEKITKFVNFMLPLPPPLLACTG
jgi:hypothetical protein